MRDYWLILRAAFLSLFLIEGLALYLARQDFRLKQATEYEYIGNVSILTWKRLAQMSVLSLITGFLSGTLGIGGGLVYVPVFVGLGMHPDVASATGMHVVLFSSFAQFLLFIESGVLSVGMVLWEAGIVILGSLLGQVVIMFLVKKHGRHSIVLIFLILVLVVGIAMVPVFVIGSLEEGLQLWNFYNFCSSRNS